ncbi:hypothetical protein KU713_23925, partial [Salmonella enterica subsp. enterica serovar Mbandaka]|nr:hypothetical protein [Salmonella enterica subsp. enterica serovar Mbandaka]
LQQGKQYGIKHNRQNSACQHQVLSRLRQQVERHAESGENKGDVGIASLTVDMGITIGKVVAFIAIMMLVGRRLVPWIMARS